MGRRPALNERAAPGLSCGAQSPRVRTLHAPAASLAFAFAPLRRRGGRHAVELRMRPQFAPLPRPCPVPRPVRCSLRASRSRASARRAPLRSPARLRPRPCGDRPAASRRRSALRPVGRHLAAPSALRASGALCVGIRSGGVRASASLRRGRRLARFALLGSVPPPARGAVLAAPLADWPPPAADPAKCIDV